MCSVAESLSLMCQICKIFSKMLEKAFVTVEELVASSSSQERGAGQVDGLSDSALLCVHLVSWVHCGSWTG